jgi:hypothetical protein
MLNPSAAVGLPANYPAQDYGRLFDHTKAAGVGVIGIRVLAGGALSGSAERHPIASPPPEPIGSAMNYEADVRRAFRLMPLVKEGFAASLTEAATRFAISHRENRQRAFPNSTLTKQVPPARVFAPHKGRSLRLRRQADRSVLRVILQPS